MSDQPAPFYANFKPSVCIVSTFVDTLHTHATYICLLCRRHIRGTEHSRRHVRRISRAGTRETQQFRGLHQVLLCHLGVASPVQSGWWNVKLVSPRGVPLLLNNILSGEVLARRLTVEKGCFLAPRGEFRICVNPSISPHA